MDDGVTALSLAAHKTDPVPDFSALARPRFGLRAKGMVSLLAMFVYVALFALYVTRDREQLLGVVKEYGQVQGQELALANLKSALILSTVELGEARAAREDSAARQGAGIHVGAIARALADLAKQFPGLEPRAAEFRRLAAAFGTNGTAEIASALRASALALIAGSDRLMGAIDENRQALERRVDKANRDLFVVWVVGSATGAIGFGVLVAVFFRRLATDIGSLEQRAIAVVRGYRDAPLVIRRRDEVGRLAQAVNGLQGELRRWEQQQEINRQQRFHQEKMAAVGSLAAAVAHEVMNPIAAISGIAQEIANEAETGDIEGTSVAHANARLIVEHTERIGVIMRQVSDLSARHSRVAEALDVNGLVQGTCGFVRYDRRFRRVGLTLRLDSALPAAHGVADHVTQVLMNLLINAADAMEGLDSREPRIVVSTVACDGDVMVSVHDNGCGMAEATLHRAFDEFFSTKPAERGRGIGLFLCRTLMEQDGGRIALESEPGHGTVARFFLPALARAGSAA